MVRSALAAAAVIAVAVAFLLVQATPASAFPLNRERDYALGAPGDGPMFAADLNRDGRPDLVVA